VELLGVSAFNNKKKLPYCELRKKSDERKNKMKIE
jgi:hypothetical protein